MNFLYLSAGSRRERLPLSKTTCLGVVLASVFVALATVAFSGCARTLPHPSWPVSDLEPSPELHYGQLPNGFRYILQRNALPAGRVSMHLNVQAGSLNESDSERGMAHFLEHLQFNGSAHFPPGELVKYFQRIGMDFGPDANAHTGFDETVYDILLAGNRLEDIREGLVVLNDYAQGALLLPEEIASERRVVLAEKRSRDSASYRTFVRTLAFEFPGARLPERLPIGDSETILRMDRPMIKGFYDAWYRPELMMLVAVGDFSIPDMEAAVADIFGNLAPRAPARPYLGFGAFHHDGVKVFHYYEKEAGETTVRLEVVAPAEKKPDSRRRREHRFMADVADRIVQDRLNALVGKPGTPFTSAEISSGMFLKEVLYAEISAECDPEKWSPTLAVIEQTIRQAIEFGFTQHELSRVKKDISAELDQAVKRMPTRLSQAIASNIIRTANRDRVPLSAEQERALYAPILRKATPEDVLTAFRETWHPKHRLVFVTGNADISKTSADVSGTLLDAYRSAAATAVYPPEEKPQQAFPYLPVPKSGAVATEKETVAGVGVTRIKYANGIEVLIKPTDFKADDIQVRVSFGSGREGVPAGLPGLGLFAEDLINESGVGRLTRDELETALAGQNLAVTFSVKEDRFVFKGQTGNASCELLFQLLTTRLLDPALRPEAAQLVKTRYAQSYKEDASTFRGAMRAWGYRMLAGGDPRFGLVPFGTFAARTIAEVDNWLIPFFKEAPLEVAIVGDIDLDRAEQLAATYFGTLEARHGTAFQEATVGFPEGRRFDTKLNTRIDNSLLVVALPTTDVWDISLTRRLSILAQIISENLRVVIREKLGATYSPFAVNRGSRAYRGYGVLLVFSEVAPGDAERVNTEIRALLEKLARDGIDEDLLRRSLDPTLTGIRDLQKQNSYWADTVLSGASRHPEQLVWPLSIASDYAAITIEEINALAQRYLLLQRAATLFFSPGKSPHPGSAG